MDLFWKNKKVLVTGGAGFLGSFLVEELLQKGAHVTVLTRNKENLKKFLSGKLDQVSLVQADLFQLEETKQAMENQEYLFHLASLVGGIEYNIQRPASVFQKNMQMHLNLMEAARMVKPQQICLVSSACVYPRFCQIPTPESEGFVGRPEPTNEGYGFSKRMLEYLGEAYEKEYGLKVSILRPYNLYGPRDNFDPSSSHVIPALIRRIWKEKENPLCVWGSGKQSRSFLFVRDAARGLIQGLENYPKADPINLGSEQEVSIAELVVILQEIYQDLEGTSFEYEFDLEKPEGQPRRKCDGTKARELIGFEAKTELKTGLIETVQWYKERGMP